MSLPRLAPAWQLSPSALARRNADSLPRAQTSASASAAPFSAHSEQRRLLPFQEYISPRVALPFRPVLDWRVMQEEAVRLREAEAKQREEVQRIQARVAELAARERSDLWEAAVYEDAERSPPASATRTALPKGRERAKRLASAGTRRKAGRHPLTYNPNYEEMQAAAEAKEAELAILGSIETLKQQESTLMMRALTAPEFQHGARAPFINRAGLSRSRALRSPLIGHRS